MSSFQGAFANNNAAAGAVTQLIALGAMDSFISKGAKYTYFKSRHVKYTNFSMEAAVQSFQGNVAFGSQAQITLNRSGDLIHYMYVMLEIPGITACKSGEQGAICSGQFATGSGYPTATEGGRHADNEVYASYLNSDELPGSVDTCQMAEALLKGKQRWSRDKYGSCTLPEGCDGQKKYFEEKCAVDIGDEESWACWTNAIGQHLIEKATIVIGGANIDTLYSDLLFIYDEVMGKSGKMLTESIGKRRTQQELICDSRSARLLYVPLPFWFTRNSGSALSLASLQFHGVQVQVEFAPLQECIITSSTDTVVRNCATGAHLQASDLQAALETTYIYLDSAERALFSNNSHEALIQQNQIQTAQNQNGSSVAISLTMNHPIIELFWIVRRVANEKANRWFDYSGIDGRDPVLKASLQLNSQNRFNKPGQWFRTIQPFQHHSRIPEAFIGNYSFALYPESEAPSGSCNFSRIDHVTLTLSLQEGLGREAVNVIVFARSLNVLRMRDGLGGLAFSNFGTPLAIEGGF